VYGLRELAHTMGVTASLASTLPWARSNRICVDSHRGYSRRVNPGDCSGFSRLSNSLGAFLITKFAILQTAASSVTSQADYSLSCRITFGPSFFRLHMSFERTSDCRAMRLAALFLIAVACIFSGGAFAKSCDVLLPGTVLEVRLSTPVSSYFSHPGDLISATLTENVMCDGRVVLPAGIDVEGTVGSVRKVGWGIRHETAALRLDFTHLAASDSDVSIKTRVMEVYDARENVNNGVIQGIRGTDTPQGRINSRLKHLPTWNPYSDSILIVYKLTFPIFPEPEIWYGRGTDMELQLTEPIAVPQFPVHPIPERPFTYAELIALEDMASRFPERAFTVDHKDADVINIAFIGSREEIGQAFHAAGWTGSDRFSKSAFFKEFHAFLSNSTYADAPMRPMLVGDSAPDILWQKSLNTYSKRDHIRAWRWSEDYDETPIWIGATTHDVGATLSVRYKRFVHHIASNVDQERSKVIRDLRLAGCVDSVYLAPRLHFPPTSQNATGDSIRTDGAVAFVRVQECRRIEGNTPKEFHAGNRPFRYARQQILTLRSDIWRANIIYGAFDLGRMLHSAFRHPEGQPAQQDARRDSTQTPTNPGSVPFIPLDVFTFH
jgi:LssY C-terminus